MMRRLFALFLLWLPTLVLAAGASPDDKPGSTATIGAGLFDVATTDKSLDYLGRIFGPVGELPLYGTNFLFKEIFTIMSAVFIIFALVIIVWTSAISLINTAVQGEVMGKKWSSIWVPLRALSGTLLLLPTDTGYNHIQVFVMWVILNGIGAANQLWNTVLDFYDAGIGVTSSQPSLEEELRKPGVGDLIKHVFEGMVCREAVNQFMGGPQIDVWVTDHSFVIGDVGTRKPVCGEFRTRDFSTIATKYAMAVGDPVAIGRMQTTGLMQVASLLEEDAYSAIYDSPGSWGISNNFFSGMLLYKSLIAELQTLGQASPTQKSRNDGWVVAGNYYSKLVSKDLNNNLGKINPTYSDFDLTTIPQLSADDRKQLTERIHNRTKQFINKAVAAENLAKPPQRTQIGLGASNVHGSASQAWDQSFGKVKEVGLAFIDYLTNARGDSPIQSMARIGSEILLTVEILLGVILATAAILAAVMNFGVCFQGAGRMIYDIMQLTLPIVAFILATLWAGGVTLAIYLPLVPFIIYTFTVIGWMIAVVEAMVAAPLIALGLTTPSEDELSHAGHAMVLLLNLALRPSLIVIGYVVAMKLFDVGIQIMNFGFRGTVEATLSGMTIFSTVALVVLYVVFILTLAEKCFSAIYTIPDKVITWIGGQAESSEAADAVRSAKQGTDKGAQVGQQMGQGAAEWGGNIMKSSKKGQDKKATAKKTK